MRLLMGVVAGYFLGLLIAPQSGEKTREMLAEKAREIAEKPKRAAEEKIREVARRSEAKAGDIGSELGRKAAETAVRNVTDELLGDKTDKSA